jgi:hypothetical protein
MYLKRQAKGEEEDQPTDRLTNPKAKNKKQFLLNLFWLQFNRENNKKVRKRNAQKRRGPDDDDDVRRGTRGR